MPYGPQRWIPNLETTMRGHVDLSAALVVAAHGPGSLIGFPLLAYPSLLPNGAVTDPQELVDMTEVYTGGLLHVYRVNSLWCEAVSGDVTPTVCGTVEQGRMVVQPWGALPPISGVTGTFVQQITLPSDVYVYGNKLLDPCVLTGAGTLTRFPVLYVCTTTVPVPRGIERAAMPEWVIGIGDTDGSILDDEGAARAISNAGCPDWMQQGDPAINNAGEWAPRSRTRYP